MARNQYGMGSIQVRKNRKQQPTSYFCRYKDDRSPSFAYNQAGREQAEQWLRERTHEVVDQMYVPMAERHTFGEIVPAFLAKQQERTKWKGRKSIQQTRVDEFTAHLSKFYAQIEVQTAAGRMRLYDVKLTDIDHGMIQDIASKLRVAKGTEKTALNWYGTFTSVVKFAAAHPKLSGLKINPCLNVGLSWDTKTRAVDAEQDLPDREKLPPDYVSWIIRNAETLRSKALFALASTTGLRQSEIRALQWSNLDLEHQRVHVRQTINKDGKIAVVKTTAGERHSANALPLPHEVTAILREYWLSCGKPNDRFVFPNPNNPLTFVSNTDAWRDELDRLAFKFVGLRLARKSNPHALRVYRGDDLLVSYGGETAKADAFAAHGADRVKFHWLRHFYASMLIHQNTPTQDITRLMGHSSIQETERTYNFWLPKKQYDDYAANVVSEMKL